MQWARAVGARDRAVFFKGLGLLFGSGVRLTRAFELLAAQAEIPAMAEACRSISKRVESGSTIYQAMACHPEVFPQLQLRLIQVAQATGALPSILTRLAEYEEKSHAIEHRVRSSLTYPMFILGACVLLVTFLPPYLFGSLSKLMAGQKLPLVTRIVIGVSHVLSSPVFLSLCAVGAVALVGAWRRAREQARFQRWLGATVLRLPGLGTSFRWLVVARFARALEVMLNVGVPVNHALKLAGNACGNASVDEGMPVAIQALLNGSTVAGSLKTLTVFPTLFLQAVRAGEESGAVGAMLGRMADLYEVELESAVDRFLALLEPATMLVMGLIAGFLIVATTLPLLEVIKTL